MAKCDNKKTNQLTFGKQKCLVCKEKPDAYWHSFGGVITICNKCAISILPKLIADSANSFITDQSIFKKIWQEAETNYWKAVSASLSLKLRRINETK